ncbi:hypothetical protein GCM10009609_26190 [Pseudonocardia aurantiaca]|uniref:Uncharacterized protein n=1 Tax=Pseudonocardia aurantiaca TaxID=75290 RepID=A0ABW4FH07_9PSEU
MSGCSARSSRTPTYAAPVEAAVDVHTAELARRVGLLGAEEGFSSAVGQRVTGTFRKGS